MRVGLTNCKPRVDGDGYSSDAVIKHVATDRYNRKYGPTRRVGKLGEVDPIEDGQRRLREIAAYELGLKGERAVARALGVPMNVQNYENRGDNRTNLTTPRGVPIDVVTAQPLGTGCVDERRVPDLRMRTAEKPRDDLALVLVVYLSDYYEPYIVGWMWESELRRLDRRKTFVEGKNAENFTAPPSALRPFATLVYASPEHVPTEPSAQPALFDIVAEKVDSRVWQGER